MMKKNNEVTPAKTEKTSKKAIKNEESTVLMTDGSAVAAKEKRFGKKKIQANELSDAAKSSMTKRIVSAVVGLIILIPCIFLGEWFYFALVSLALAVAVYEILGCANKRTFLIYVIYLLFTALIAYWPMFRGLVTKGLTGFKVESYFTSIYLSILATVIGMFFTFTLTIIYKDFSIRDACFLITVCILIGLGFQSLLFLRFYPISIMENPPVAWVFTPDSTIKPSLLIIFVILSTFLADGGAYFVGVFFGKNKMNERISPKKTWEGFIGGFVISAILTFIIGLCFAAGNYPILPSLDLQHWYLILILSAITPLFAVLGDFVFSCIKRHFGIKDYGKLIPGHGGVLDRLDSIIFACIVAAIFVHVTSNINAGVVDWTKILV